MDRHEVDDKLLEELDQNNHQLLLDIVDEKNPIDWEDFIRDTDILLIKLKMKYKRERPYEIVR